MDVSLKMSHAHAEQPVKLSTLQLIAMGLGAIALGMLIYGSLVHGAAEEAGHHAAAHAPHVLSIIPFVALLLCIAVFPLVPAISHWWESNLNRLMVSLAFAAVTLAYYLFADGAGKVVSILDHAIIVEYIPFIMLLLSLYVISGGICLKGDLAAHPATNTAFLAIGATLASLIGTTGASMLLIRPLLKTNSERKRVVHTVIFFIFLVSNIGGCLLPIGDPPLFLGYLYGVPFTWTLHLWVEWAFANAILLTIYFVWDTWAYKHETKRDIARDETRVRRLTLDGPLNILWLLGVVLCVAFVQPGEEFLGLGFHAFPYMRELLMIGFILLSLKFTDPAVRRANKFNYHAILEVAALFVGIFICMQAPIEILRASGDTLGKVLDAPWKFFWATGSLSSFLDNAPTYVVFFQTANSMTHEAGPGIFQLTDGNFIRQDLLVAISLGAVFMGSMTYIGNGPNFMVKSIAEQSGVKMPSFFGYMLYSCGILLPVFLLITVLFL